MQQVFTVTRVASEKLDVDSTGESKLENAACDDDYPFKSDSAYATIQVFFFIHGN